MASVLRFFFTRAFPEEVTVTLLTVNLWRIVGLQLSCMHPAEGEEVLKQKGRLKEKALNDHIEKFSISQLSWSPTPGVFICCRAGGKQLAALSTVFEINNLISPAAVLKLKVMTRSGVTEVTSGVASLTEMKLFTAASEVASPSEVEL